MSARGANAGRVNFIIVFMCRFLSRTLPFKETLRARAIAARHNLPDAAQILRSKDSGSVVSVRVNNPDRSPLKING